MEEIKSQHRRWYDKDPVLKEALELLRLAPGDKRDAAAEFVIQLQEQVAADVIEKVYDIMAEFHDKGKRWYDNDPMVMKAIELLRVAPKKTQKDAALKLLTALESNDGGMETIKE
ncbi:MAG: hypothetical protein ACI4SM_03910 [Candidatus Gastranaerophilaceae bacterium]